MSVFHEQNEMKVTLLQLYLQLISTIKDWLRFSLVLIKKNVTFIASVKLCINCKVNHISRIFDTENEFLNPMFGCGVKIFPDINPIYGLSLGLNK